MTIRKNFKLKIYYRREGGEFGVGDSKIIQQQPKTIKPSEKSFIEKGLENASVFMRGGKNGGRGIFGLWSVKQEQREPEPVSVKKFSDQVADQIALTAAASHIGLLSENDRKEMENIARKNQIQYIDLLVNPDLVKDLPDALKNQLQAKNKLAKTRGDRILSEKLKLEESQTPGQQFELLKQDLVINQLIKDLAGNGVPKDKKVEFDGYNYEEKLNFLVEEIRQNDNENLVNEYAREIQATQPEKEKQDLDVIIDSADFGQKIADRIIKTKLPAYLGVAQKGSEVGKLLQDGNYNALMGLAKIKFSQFTLLEQAQANFSPADSETNKELQLFFDGYSEIRWGVNDATRENVLKGLERLLNTAGNVPDWIGLFAQRNAGFFPGVRGLFEMLGATSVKDTKNLYAQFIKTDSEPKEILNSHRKEIKPKQSLTKAVEFLGGIASKLNKHHKDFRLYSDVYNNANKLFASKDDKAVNQEIQALKSQLDALANITGASLWDFALPTQKSIKDELLAFSTESLNELTNTENIETLSATLEQKYPLLFKVIEQLRYVSDKLEPSIVASIFDYKGFEGNKVEPKAQKNLEILENTFRSDDDGTLNQGLIGGASDLGQLTGRMIGGSMRRGVDLLNKVTGGLVGGMMPGVTFFTSAGQIIDSGDAMIGRLTQLQKQGATALDLHQYALDNFIAGASAEAKTKVSIRAGFAKFLTGSELLATKAVGKEMEGITATAAEMHRVFEYILTVANQELAHSEDGQPLPRKFETKEELKEQTKIAGEKAGFFGKMFNAQETDIEGNQTGERDWLQTGLNMTTLAVGMAGTQMNLTAQGWGLEVLGMGGTGYLDTIGNKFYGASSGDFGIGYQQMVVNIGDFVLQSDVGKQATNYFHDRVESFNILQTQSQLTKNPVIVKNGVVLISSSATEKQAIEGISRLPAEYKSKGVSYVVVGPDGNIIKGYTLAGTGTNEVSSSKQIATAVGVAAIGDEITSSAKNLAKNQIAIQNDGKKFVASYVVIQQKNSGSQGATIQVPSHALPKNVKVGSIVNLEVAGKGFQKFEVVVGVSKDSFLLVAQDKTLSFEGGFHGKRFSASAQDLQAKAPLQITTPDGKQQIAGQVTQSWSTQDKGTGSIISLDPSKFELVDGKIKGAFVAGNSGSEIAISAGGETFGDIHQGMAVVTDSTGKVVAAYQMVGNLDEQKVTQITNSFKKVTEAQGYNLTFEFQSIVKPAAEQPAPETIQPAPIQVVQEPAPEPVTEKIAANTQESTPEPATASSTVVETNANTAVASNAQVPVERQQVPEAANNVVDRPSSLVDNGKFNPTVANRQTIANQVTSNASERVEEIASSNGDKPPKNVELQGSEQEIVAKRDNRGLEIKNEGPNKDYGTIQLKINPIHVDGRVDAPLPPTQRTPITVKPIQPVIAKPIAPVLPPKPADTSIRPVFTPQQEKINKANDIVVKSVHEGYSQDTLDKFRKLQQEASVSKTPIIQPLINVGGKVTDIAKFGREEASKLYNRLEAQLDRDIRQAPDNASIAISNEGLIKSLGLLEKHIKSLTAPSSTIAQAPQQPATVATTTNVKGQFFAAAIDKIPSNTPFRADNGNISIKTDNGEIVPVSSADKGLTLQARSEAKRLEIQRDQVAQAKGGSKRGDWVNVASTGKSGLDKAVADISNNNLVAQASTEADPNKGLSVVSTDYVFIDGDKVTNQEIINNYVKYDGKIATSPDGKVYKVTLPADTGFVGELIANAKTQNAVAATLTPVSVPVPQTTTVAQANTQSETSKTPKFNATGNVGLAVDAATGDKGMQGVRDIIGQEYYRKLETHLNNVIATPALVKDVAKGKSLSPEQLQITHGGLTMAQWGEFFEKVPKAREVYAKAPVTSTIDSLIMEGTQKSELDVVGMVLNALNGRISVGVKTEKTYDIAATASHSTNFRAESEFTPQNFSMKVPGLATNPGVTEGITSEGLPIRVVLSDGGVVGATLEVLKNGKPFATITVNGPLARQLASGELEGEVAMKAVQNSLATQVKFADNSRLRPGSRIDLQRIISGDVTTNPNYLSSTNFAVDGRNVGSSKDVLKMDNGQEFNVISTLATMSTYAAKLGSFKQENNTNNESYVQGLGGVRFNDSDAVGMAGKNALGPILQLASSNPEAAAGVFKTISQAMNNPAATRGDNSKEAVFIRNAVSAIRELPWSLQVQFRDGVITADGLEKAQYLVGNVNNVSGVKSALLLGLDLEYNYYKEHIDQMQGRLPVFPDDATDAEKKYMIIQEVKRDIKERGLYVAEFKIDSRQLQNDVGSLHFLMKSGQENRSGEDGFNKSFYNYRAAGVSVEQATLNSAVIKAEIAKHLETKNYLFGVPVGIPNAAGVSEAAFALLAFTPLSIYGTQGATITEGKSGIVDMNNPAFTAAVFATYLTTNPEFAAAIEKGMKNGTVNNPNGGTFYEVVQGSMEEIVATGTPGRLKNGQNGIMYTVGTEVIESPQKLNAQELAQLFTIQVEQAKNAKAVGTGTDLKPYAVNDMIYKASIATVDALPVGDYRVRLAKALSGEALIEANKTLDNMVKTLDTLKKPTQVEFEAIKNNPKSIKIDNHKEFTQATGLPEDTVLNMTGAFYGPGILESKKGGSYGVAGLTFSTEELAKLKMGLPAVGYINYCEGNRVVVQIPTIEAKVDTRAEFRWDNIVKQFNADTRSGSGESFSKKEHVGVAATPPQPETPVEQPKEEPKAPKHDGRPLEKPTTDATAPQQPLKPNQTTPPDAKPVVDRPPAPAEINPQQPLKPNQQIPPDPNAIPKQIPVPVPDKPIINTPLPEAVNNPTLGIGNQPIPDAAVIKPNINGIPAKEIIAPSNLPDPKNIVTPGGNPFSARK